VGEGPARESGAGLGASTSEATPGSQPLKAGAFPVSEARQRLGRPDIKLDGPKTLSEIYQLQGDVTRIGGAAEPMNIGTYL
jgi:hypothetical protein